jgi:hypothetical protein
MSVGGDAQRCNAEARGEYWESEQSERVQFFAALPIAISVGMIIGMFLDIRSLLGPARASLFACLPLR